MNAAAQSTAKVSHKLGASHRAPNLVLQEHWFQVPLDYAREDSPPLQIFVREVVSATASKENLPYLIYLQGGESKAAPYLPCTDIILALKFLKL
jgi:hypothetical protein